MGVTDADVTKLDHTLYEQLRNKLIQFPEEDIEVETKLERHLRSLERDRDNLSVYLALYNYITALMDSYEVISKLSNIDAEFPKLYH